MPSTTQARLIGGTLISAGLTAAVPHAVAQDIPVEVRPVGTVGSAASVAAGDLDGDGTQDISAVGPGVGTTEGFFNNGGQPPAWNFTRFFDDAGTGVSNTGDITVMVTADLDGNGIDDKIWGHQGFDPVAIPCVGVEYYGQVQTFLPFGYLSSYLPVPDAPDLTDVVPTGSAVTDLAVADLDRDGDLDIVATTIGIGPGSSTGNAVFWVENRTAGPIELGNSWLWTYHPIAQDIGITESVSVGDVNGDRNPDIVVGLGGSQNAILVYINNPGGPQNEGFTALPPITGFSGAVTVELADADFDGDRDIFYGTDVPGAGAGDAGWLESVGGSPIGFLQHPLTSAGEFDVRDIVSGDFDADGDMDFAAATLNPDGVTGRINWWDNDGTASFTQRVLHTWAVTSSPNSLTAKDLDGDGDLDFAVAVPQFSEGPYFTSMVDWIENKTDPLPLITQQPAGQFVAPGESVVLSVVTASSGSGYQWFLNGVEMTDGPGVKGALAPTLTLTADNDLEGAYTCVVSNQFGSTTSNSVVLGVSGQASSGCFVDRDSSGVLDIFDVTQFLTEFDAGCP